MPSDSGLPVVRLLIVTFCIRGAMFNAPASWTAVALHRFSLAPQNRPPFQITIEPVLKFPRVLFLGKRLAGEARRRSIPLVGLRLRSNDARRLFPQKPSGRQAFWLGPALARSLPPAPGMLVPVRKHLAALAKTKIPGRSTLCNFQTGS